MVIAGITFTAAPAKAAKDDRAVVVRVIDGDTVVLKIDSKETRVRLLNIDTPETKDPTEPVECGGLVASAYLTALLPVGAKVTLKYDRERLDRYGRTLAAVYTADDKFISEEIARQGYGMAVTFGANDKNFKTVQAAQKIAQTKFRGLYSKTTDCTVRTQVKALKAETQQLAAVDSGTAPSGEVTALVARAAALIAGIAALQRLADLDQPSIAMSILLATPKIGYGKGLRNMDTKARSIHKKLVTAETGAVAREAAAAEQAAAAKAAADAAAAAKAAADARAAADAQAAADARSAADARALAAQRAAEQPYVAPYVEPYVAPAVPSVDTYTGCRAYGNNGTSVDDKGRRYTKIPCP
ncbi:thermonuclease family protein [Cryobacterium sp. Y29]|uniref:thermonuclease family protein n=1 Tax=Cryobacterium sp. Y29 TaxID=2048285 RepID=UPI001E635F87|nr:thermonuclease family protein [Cryobacterium sp. Y29]